jgi:hypothetical protein
MPRLAALCRLAEVAHAFITTAVKPRRPVGASRSRSSLTSRAEALFWGRHHWLRPTRQEYPRLLPPMARGWLSFIFRAAEMVPQ